MPSARSQGAVNIHPPERREGTQPAACNTAPHPSSSQREPGGGTSPPPSNTSADDTNAPTPRQRYPAKVHGAGRGWADEACRRIFGVFSDCVNGVKDDRMAGRKEKEKALSQTDFSAGNKVYSLGRWILYCRSTILLALVS